MVTSTALATRLWWSISPGMPWSVSPGMGGQLAPECGGHVHQNLHFLVSLVLQSVDDIYRFGRFNRAQLEKHTNPLLASLSSSFAKAYSLKYTLNQKNSSPILHLVADWRKQHSFDERPYELYPGDDDKISTYRRSLVQFYSKLNVPSGLVFRNKKDYNKLLNYLDTYALIVDCKNASLRLTKNTWKTICLNFMS